MPRVRLSYTKPQLEIFFPDKPTKFTSVPKGRRFGGTRGGAHACIEWAMEGDPVLWGDTIYGNIIRYVDRYFKPALKTAEEIDHNDPLQWEWKEREQVLKIGDRGGYIDFRSEDRPENWEGFGYKRIFLNEAGIILKNRSLYVNTVLPMLMDFPESELYAIGTPKGKTLSDGSEHPFYTISKRGEEGLDGYRTLRYSSYHNPKLTAEDIDQLKDEINRMSPGEEQQEIFGHFIESTAGFAFFPCFKLSEHENHAEYDPLLPLHITLDFNSMPYMTLLVFQISKGQGRYRVQGLKEYCLTHPLATTDSVCKALMHDLIEGDFKGHRAGLMYYGDYSGKKKDPMERDGIRHNYDIVEQRLGRWMGSNYSNRLMPNPGHIRARDFMNAIFAGQLNIDIRLNPSMINTIRDITIVKQDADGGLLKEMVLDRTTGVRYEKCGHCSQATYYLVCSAFNDTFETFAS